MPQSTTCAQYGLRIPADQRAKILDYLATYLGPNPPPAQPASAPAGIKQVEVKQVDGETLYNQQCTACHQANGQGVAGQFPPLAGNRDLFISRDFPALVVLFGLEGEITVEGKPFKAAMPPFAHLSDRDIAAVIGYVRSAWNNEALGPKNFSPLTAADVKALRAKALTAAAVLSYRASQR